MTFIPWNTITMLLILVGICVVQIFLSRRQSRWPGLILPALTFAYSLLMVLNIAAVGGAGQIVAVVLSVLLLCNIPTAVLLIIYALCRGRERTRKELDKMKSQDLS